METAAHVTAAPPSCAFVGGAREAEALARLDAQLAAKGYRNVPIVYAAETNDAIPRGRTLGFPAEDAVAVHIASGAGALDAFKILAKKLLGLLNGQPVTSRQTPPE